MRDFFVCLTPLHILIAKRIIELRSLPQVTAVYFFSIDDEKNRYYFDHLKDVASERLYLKKSNSPFDFVLILLRLLPLKIRGAFNGGYSGNIKTGYSRFVLWTLRPKSIYTMDDGIGNISIGSDYFQTPNEHKAAEFFFAKFGKRFLYRNIINRIVQNYSIYKYPNVFNPSVYISLFDVPSSCGTNKPLKTVFLSGALSADPTSPALSREGELDFYKRVFDRFKIDLVIKHPRQDVWIDGGPPISTSVEIGEHQVLQLMKEYNVVVVASFYSSVLLNLPDTIKKINVLSRSSDRISPGFNRLFEEVGIIVEYI